MKSAIFEVFAQLEPTQTIIAVNRRLAFYLHEQYRLYQAEQGQSAWQTPDIIPYQSWLTRCYQQGLDNGLIAPELLINEQHEVSVWEQIITKSQKDRPLLHIQATALEAKRAWQLLWEWQCPTEHPSFHYHEDCLAFQNWANEFQRYLAANNWIDCSRLPERLLAMFVEHPQQAPAIMHWIGFLDLTPQQQKLMALLNKLGCKQQVHQPQQPAATIQQVSCSDPLAEIRTMARWAKKLATSVEHRIGCIVPNLSQMRADVLRIFMEIFAPHLLLEPLHADSQLPFTISAGVPLVDYPIIHAALTALQLNQPQIPASTLMYLLRSPFFGHPEEHFIQIKLQRYLSQYLEHALSHSQLLRWLQAQTLKCQWLDKLVELLTLLAEQPRQQAPSQWAEAYSQQLQLLGWPGERALTSEEYQLQLKWQELLTLFASYDQVYSTLSQANAWQKLNQLISSTLFQPETPDTAVQILGTLEAAGQHFTHLWIMGLDDKHWPPKPAPNSFLPWALQRDLQIPHASTLRETAFCKTLLQHYYQSSQHVIASYSQHDGEQNLRPTCLIQGLASIALSELPLAPDVQLAQQIQREAQVEVVELMQAPPITDNEQVRGGVGIFKSQAMCPFKAFAEFRLGAREAEPWELGLAPAERGNLLHHCLESLWQALGSQQRLLELSNAQLLEYIRHAITGAVSKLQWQRNGTLGNRLVQLEIERLTNLLLAWLDIEKQRSPFTVVAVEQSTHVTVKDISLALKIDRIDQLASGEYVIIDYKSGKVNVNWEDEHLTEPQLPLYCTSSAYPVAAVALAQIRSDEMKFHGLAHADGLLPKIKAHENWPELLAHWQQALEKLATDFLAGHAAIAPKDKQTCAYCKLELVCRINEKNV